MNPEVILSLIRKHEAMIKQLNAMLSEAPIKKREFVCATDDILKVINEEFGCDARERTRKHPFVFARHFLCFFLYEHTRMTYTSISTFVGLGDHSSVINSIRQTMNLKSTDEYYANIFNKIKARLKEVSL